MPAWLMPNPTQLNPCTPFHAPRPSTRGYGMPLTPTGLAPRAVVLDALLVNSRIPPCWVPCNNKIYGFCCSRNLAVTMIRLCNLSSPTRGGTNPKTVLPWRGGSKDGTTIPCPFSLQTAVTPAPSRNSYSTTCPKSSPALGLNIRIVSNSLCSSSFPGLSGGNA